MSVGLGIALGSLGWGLFKGAVVGRALNVAADPHDLSPGRLAHSVVLGPLSEETLYRLLPIASAKYAGVNLPFGMTAIPFGLAHYQSRMGCPDVKPPRGFNAWRVSEAAFGGLMYEVAFRRHGLLAAVAAHGLHNLGTMLGALASSGRARAPRPILPRSSRPLSDGLSHRRSIAHRR